MDNTFDKEMDEAYAEYEKARHERMVKCGLIRTIVVKHNKEGKESFYRRETIIHNEIFHLGLSNIKPTESHNWLKDEWETHDSNCVNLLLEDKPNGIYEIVGELYYFGWISGYYEREYESDLEVRSAQIQSLTYDQAFRFAGDFFEQGEIYLTKLCDTDNEPKNNYSHWDTQIHPYMDALQILKHHANALISIMRSFWSSEYTSTDNMTKNELDMFIHMCMLEIDSKSESGVARDNLVFVLAAKMDKEVKETISYHEELFGDKR